jgi:uncharacterized protein YbjT (DUF2867 family)
MSDRGRILVTGATGYVGGRLLNALLERSTGLRCLARRPEAIAPRPGLEVIKGDALDSRAVRRALEGVDVAFYLIHAMDASVVIGSGSLSFELVRSLTERLPVMITPRWVETRAQPIAIEA